MAKISGLAQNFYLGGRDLSGDVGALDGASSPRGLVDVTAMDKSAIERLLTVTDGQIQFKPYFNDALDQEHDALKGLPATDIQVMWLIGLSIGDVGCGLVAKQVNYDWARGPAGELLGDVQCLGNGNPLEWGVALTPGKRTDTTATNGARQANGASTANGLQAYLQVFSFTGTSVTIAIEESSDNGSGDAYTAKATFASVSGRTVERITATGTVEEDLRIATSGTFSNVVFAVIVRRGTPDDD